MAIIKNQSANLTPDKHSLLKRISAIHAIKCNKSISFELALKSFKELSDFKTIVEESIDSKLLGISSSINAWQNTNPQVYENEIIELLK